MILVPRQLQRSGMTGRVPYYGGRLTPAQITALQHPEPPAPPVPPAPPPAAAPPPQATVAGLSGPDVMRRLREMRDQGVLTDEEFATISARVRP